MSPDGFVDLGEEGIEAMWDARGFDVSCHLQEGKRIGLDSDKGIVVLRRRVSDVVQDDGRGVRVEEALYALQVDEDSAGGLLGVLEWGPAGDLDAVGVIDWSLFAFFVQKGQVAQLRGGQPETGASIGAIVEGSILIY